MKFAKVSNSILIPFLFTIFFYRLSVQPSVEGIEDINSLVFNEEYKRFWEDLGRWTKVDVNKIVRDLKKKFFNF